MIDTLPVHHHTRVISTLKKGDVVAFPTGTTYGLGVNCLDKSALEKLTAIKGRSSEKAYSIILPTKTAENFVDLSEKEKKVLLKFSDRPLTILVKPKAALEHLGKDGKIGLRTADHPFIKTLAELLEFPVTATSANKAGLNPCYSVEEMQKMFPTETFMAVDAGRLPTVKPSTVAKFENGKWEILREGDVKKKELEAV